MTSTIAARFPASSAQEAVWFLSQLFPDSSVYNLLWLVKFAGPLHIGTLLGSIQAIVDRHDALRASFTAQGEGLAQVIPPKTVIDCPLADLSDLPTNESQARLDEQIQELGLAPFDLERGPLTRFRLIRVGKEDHRLLVSMHHLVTDGGSWSLFLDEMAAYYTGAPPPPLSMQYGQYAIWQSEMLRSGAWLKHEDYWRGRIEGASPVLNLPADRPQPGVAFPREVCLGDGERICCAAHPDRGGPRRYLGRRPWARAGRRQRQFLRVGRALAAGGAGDPSRGKTF